jgi:hypothetical protein
MEDLEEKYIEGTEREEEIFIEGLQNKKSLAELEKQYSQKVKEIRRIYEKSLRKDLEKQRETPEIKSKISSQNKEEKEFHVENIKLEDTWRNKKQVEITSLGYRIKRKINNFIKLITPNYIIYSYYKIIRILKDIFKETREFFEYIWEKISRNILNNLYYIKDGFMKVVLDMKKILEIFKRKGKKKEKEDGKKDSKK